MVSFSHGVRIFAFCGSLASVSTLVADDSFLDIPHATISGIIHKMYDLDSSAEQEISKLIETYPNSPVGPLLESGRLFMLQGYAMVDKDLKEEFERHSFRALKLAKTFYRDNRDSAEARYCLAMLELGIARYHIDHRNWFRALFKTRSGLRHLRKIQESYPDFHDAKLPFGMANCYLDNAPSYLKPFALLVGFKGDMDLGLAQLKDVRDKGLFLNLESSANLAEIHWYLRKDKESARRELKSLIQKCPNNVMFLRMIGVLEMNDQRKEVAREYFLTALDKPQIDMFQRLRTELLLKTGQIHHGEGEFDEALQYANKAISSAEDGRTLKGIRSWAFFLRGASLHGSGALEEARDAFESIKESENPHVFKLARRELKKLETG